MAETEKQSGTEDLEVTIAGAMRLLGALGADLDDLKSDAAFMDFLELQRPRPVKVPWDHRDVLAIAAMQALLSVPYENKFFAGDGLREKISLQSYRWADSMLAAKGELTVTKLEKMLSEANERTATALREKDFIERSFGATPADTAPAPEVPGV